MDIKTIIEKLSSDGDLREGDDNYAYEYEQDDDLGFYQIACQFLIDKVEVIQREVDDER